MVKRNTNNRAAFKRVVGLKREKAASDDKKLREELDKKKAAKEAENAAVLKALCETPNPQKPAEVDANLSRTKPEGSADEGQPTGGKPATPVAPQSAGAQPSERPLTVRQQKAKEAAEAKQKAKNATGTNS